MLLSFNKSKVQMRPKTTVKIRSGSMSFCIDICLFVVELLLSLFFAKCR